MEQILLFNKRNKTQVYDPDLLIVDIDRTCPILGNPYPMKDHSDGERVRVVALYREYFNKEYAKKGPLYHRVHELSSLAKSGQRLGLRCWCHPKDCHGNIIIDKINELLGKKMTNIQVKATKEIPAFLRQQYSDDEIDYKECRFVIHMPKRDGRYDWHMVKEILHFKDGRPPVPNIRYIRDYQKKFWVTSPIWRKTHAQKKEWEDLDRLIEGTSTQSNMTVAVARALGDIGLARNPFALKDSPHVYGLDVPSTVSIKYDYFMAKKDRPDTPFSIAYSDTETNMLDLDKGATKHILMQSLFQDGKLYTVILKDFLKNVPSPKKTLRALFDEHMPARGKELVKEWEIDIVEAPIDIVKLIMKRCHEWKPDFLSFWNLMFDLEKMIECVELAGYRPEDIFNDPNLPQELRYAFLKRASPSKTSASGRLVAKKPSEQWHSYLSPASFYFIDQMATYRFVRKSKQSDPSYSLDYILGKELEGLGKLKHKPADGLVGADFHIFMQDKYPGEYVIYHCWDAVCMHDLTLKTKDLTYSLPGTTEYSDFMTFESEPKRYIHKFHYYALNNHNAVAGVGGKTLVQPFDEMTISTKGNIVTLEPHLTVDTGLKIFKDYPGLKSNYYGHAGDLDVKSSYPIGQIVFNMSRATTVSELISIAGVSDHQRRVQGLNLSGGRTNAIEFSTTIYGLPTMANLSKIYDEAHRLAA